MTSADLIDMALKLDNLSEDAHWMGLSELANEASAAAAKLRLVADLWELEVSRANGEEV